MILQAKFLCTPGTASRKILPCVLLEACEGIEILNCASCCLRDRSGRSTVHRLEIVPVDAHIVYIIIKLVINTLSLM